MKRWEERSLFQQLVILLSFICALLLFYFLVCALSPSQLFAAIILITVFPVIFAYLFRQAIIKTKQALVQKNSTKSLPQSSDFHPCEQLKLTFKEKLVVGIGTILCMLATIVAANYETTRNFFIWLILIVMALGILGSIFKTVLDLLRKRPSYQILPTGLLTPIIIWKIVKAVVILVFWIWIIGFLSPILSDLLSATEKPMASSLIRVPLGRPGGIAVDSQGQIYYVANCHNRIQVYDKNGRFLRGWFFPRSGNLSATTQLIIDDNGYLHVETGYYETKYPIKDLDRKVYNVYNANGELLKKRSETFSYLKIPDVFERKDPFGNIFKVKHHLLFPKVLSVSPSGKETVIVSDPLYLKFINFPFPSAVCVLGISIIYSIWELWQKKRKTKPNKIAACSSTY
jgi:hypothetical protein